MQSATEKSVYRRTTDLIINPKRCWIKTHELIPVSKSWSEKPPLCPICRHLDRYRLNIAIGIRGRKSDLCFKDVNISCAGVRIRRRRVEKHRGGKYQLNSLCHSNPRLKWIMSNMLWCSRSHNLAAKWLLPLWWLQSFKVIYKNGEHVIAKGDAVYHVQQQEPFKEAACRHQKSGSQQLLRLRFYLFSQNLLSGLLSRLHLLHRQITERSTHLRSHFCCGSSCVSWLETFSAVPAGALVGASRPFHSLSWVSVIPSIWQLNSWLLWLFLYLLM